MKTQITMKLGKPFVAFLRELSKEGKSQSYYVEEALCRAHNLNLKAGYREKPGRKKGFKMPPQIKKLAT